MRFRLLILLLLKVDGNSQEEIAMHSNLGLRLQWLVPGIGSGRVERQSGTTYVLKGAIKDFPIYVLR